MSFFTETCVRLFCVLGDLLMNGKGQKIAFEILILFLVLGLMMLICRLWPAVILLLIGIVASVIALFIFSIKPKSQNDVREENDVEEQETPIGYALILNQITELVSNEFPGAKWVWAHPYARQRLEAGETAFILLNGAGGYSRAKVIVADNKVQRLEISAPKPVEEPEEHSEPERKDTPPENYDLLAFEWVEANIMSLNDRCNEAMGQGKTELILTSEELPTQASWVCICRELGRNEYCDVECVPTGIKINLVQ